MASRWPGRPTGAPNWFPYLGQFLSGQPTRCPRHAAPLSASALLRRAGGAELSDDRQPPVDPLSSRALADSVIAAVKAAHAHHDSAADRRDEHDLVRRRRRPWPTRSPRRFGRSTRVFQMARVGVDGVNIHTFPGRRTTLFDFQRTHTGSGAARWRPSTTASLMFAQAAPPGSHLLNASTSTSGGHPGCRRGRRASADGTFRVVAINDGSRARAPSPSTRWRPPRGRCWDARAPRRRRA